MRSSTTRASPGPTAPCEDIALADWERTLAVNLTGQFLCAQRAIPLLKASRNPSIAEPVIGRGPLRLSAAHALRSDEMGRDRAHEIAVDRARRLRHPRQRDLSRPGGRPAHRRACSRARRRPRGVAPEVVRDEALAKTSLRTPRQRGRHRQRDRVSRVAARREHLRARASGRRRHAVARLTAKREKLATGRRRRCASSRGCARSAGFRPPGYWPAPPARHGRSRRRGLPWRSRATGRARASPLRCSSSWPDCTPCSMRAC